MRIFAAAGEHDRAIMPARHFLHAHMPKLSFASDRARQGGSPLAPRFTPEPVRAASPAAGSARSDGLGPGADEPVGG